MAIITGAVHIDVGSGDPAPWTPVPKQGPVVSKRVGLDGLQGSGSGSGSS